MTDIRPIIDANCLSPGCHNEGSVNGDWTTYSGLKTVADNGELSHHVIEAKLMPPPPSGPLPLDERIKIKCWIKSGVPQ